MLNKKNFCARLVFLISLISLSSCGGENIFASRYGITKESLLEIVSNAKHAFKDTVIKNIKDGKINKNSFKKFRGAIGYENTFNHTIRDESYPNEEFGLLLAEKDRMKIANNVHKLQKKSERSLKWDKKRIDFISKLLSSDKAKINLVKIAELLSIKTNEVALSTLLNYHFIAKEQILNSDNADQYLKIFLDNFDYNFDMLRLFIASDSKTKI